MACMIAIIFIFEVRRPSETLIGILDPQMGISIIFVFSELIIYAYILLNYRY